MSRLWTAEETLFLGEFFFLRGVEWCAEQLGRSEGAVRQQAQKMGMLARPKRRKREPRTPMAGAELAAALHVTGWHG